MLPPGVLEAFVVQAQVLAKATAKAAVMIRGLVLSGGTGTRQFC